MKSWSEKIVGEALQDVTSKGHKVPQSAFQNLGRFPIIDQSQQFISGYIDDESLAWKAELPVVIFGDHTKALKFINFPFVLGADGTKVLTPKEGILPEYAYYYLQTLELPSEGYSRHFKYLKELNFIYPKCLEEQKRIAAIARKCDLLRRTRRFTQQLSDTYLQSVFLEMFGHPVNNSKGLPCTELAKLASVERGRFSPRPRNDPSYYGGKFPFIQTGDISNSQGRLRTWTQTLNEKGTKVSRSFPKGTVVIAIVGATIGVTSILDIPVYCPDSVIGIQCKDGQLFPEYLEFLLRFWRPVFLERAPETARANINLETLKPLPIPLPSLDQQQKFVQIVQRIERLRVQQQEARRQSEHLFQTVLHRAFQGEL